MNGSQNLATSCSNCAIFLHHMSLTIVCVPSLLILAFLRKKTSSSSSKRKTQSMDKHQTLANVCAIMSFVPSRFCTLGIHRFLHVRNADVVATAKEIVKTHSNLVSVVFCEVIKSSL